MTITIAPAKQRLVAVANWNADKAMYHFGQAESLGRQAYMAGKKGRGTEANKLLAQKDEHMRQYRRLIGEADRLRAQTGEKMGQKLILLQGRFGAHKHD